MYFFETVSFLLFFHESHVIIQINYLIMRNTTNRCTYRYVNLLYYEQHCLLHVSANCCGLPEDDHIRWPKHVLP